MVKINDRTQESLNEKSRLERMVKLAKDSFGTSIDVQLSGPALVVRDNEDKMISKAIIMSDGDYMRLYDQNLFESAKKFAETYERHFMEIGQEFKLETDYS